MNLRHVFQLSSQGRFIAALIMGLSSGFPLLLVGSTFQAWLVDEKIDLTTIGLLSLVQLPYSLKFLWSPLLDRFHLWPSRRKGWMLVSQIGIMLCLFLFSVLTIQEHLSIIVVMAMALAFFSATQDIAIDAYRREQFNDAELALGSSLYVVGYRIGLLLSGAFALALADSSLTSAGVSDWSFVYQIMCVIMFISSVLSWLSPSEAVSEQEKVTDLKLAVWGPFKEFFSRSGAWWILAFVLMYKAGDIFASSMTTPFMLLKGYTKTEIATVVKGVGLISLLFGGLLGGVLTMRWGILKSLWIFGILQALSTAGFWWLDLVELSAFNLAAVIVMENLTAGLGTSAYSAFMATMTNKQFTATQYALLTALMAVPRTLLAAPAGFMANTVGFGFFFLFSTFLAIPGLLLILPLKKISQ